MRFLHRASLTPGAIRKFRDKHGSLLTDFRYFIESEIVRIVGCKDADLRAHQLRGTRRYIRVRTAEIASKMNESGLGEIVHSDAYGLLAEVPGFSKTLKLLRAGHRLAVGSASTVTQSLAYAAYAKSELKLGG